jgi:hypothetical protein
VKKKKTAKIVLQDVKDPDGWHELASELGLISRDDEGNDTSDPKKRKLFEKHFDFGEYASVEIEVDEDLKIVGGRIL